MRRLDRAMYAFFLLALLADVARSQVPASLGGETAGGSMLSAASQIRVGPAGEVVLGTRRADRIAAPAVKFKGSNFKGSNRAAGFAFSRLARLFSAQSSQSTLLLLLASPFRLEFPPSSPAIAADPDTPPSRTVFAHTGSPAP